MTKTEVHKIDKDVPVPRPTSPIRESIPIDQLEVGESIMFPSSSQAAVKNLASRMKKNEGRVFVVKKMDELSHRVWRVQ